MNTRVTNLDHHFVWNNYSLAQGRNEVRWRPGKEASLSPPSSNLCSSSNLCKCSFHNAAECALVDNAQRINTIYQHFPLYYWLGLNQFATELFRNKILSRTVNCTGNKICFQDSFTKQRKSTKLQHRSSIKNPKKLTPAEECIAIAHPNKNIQKERYTEETLATRRWGPRRKVLITQHGMAEALTVTGSNFVW